MFWSRIISNSYLILIIVIFFSVIYNKESGAQVSPPVEMVSNVVVIKFKNVQQIVNNQIQNGDPEIYDLLFNYSVISLRPVIRSNKLNKIKTDFQDIYNIYYASFSGDQSPITVAASLNASPLIEYAEPKYIHTIADLPNDSLYHHQENYYNNIKAPQAWDVVKGEHGEAIIAVVDGGTDIRHSDLADNIWSNTAEVNGIDGIDDDGNGYIDDLYGWNFANKSGDPTGLESTPFNADHGTLTAGIISAISGNLTGVAGVSWNATVMAINASSTNDRKISDGIDGIIYAAENGADVISCSWGGYNIFSQYEEDIIHYAYSLGAIVVAAAGNDNSSDPFYPASYRYSLSIAGTNSSDEKWVNSNYGPDIDFAAPADSIYSTLANERYGFASGTSLSAPLAAGVVGLVKAQNPRWTGVEAGEKVRISTDSIFSAEEELGRGRLNAYRALTEISPSIKYVDYDYLDANGNRFLEAGERVHMYLSVITFWAPANNVYFKISTTSDDIVLINDEVTLSSISTSEQFILPDPFVFDLVEDLKGIPVIDFDIRIRADGYRDSDQFSFEQVFKDIFWTKNNDPNTQDLPFRESDPVLKPGPAGDWDDGFVSVQSVLFDTITSTFKMWFQGGTGLFTGSIGYASSPDGINWTKYDNPATTDPPFSASDPVLMPGGQGTWDSMATAMSSVVFLGNVYHMWYTGFSDPLHFNIGYATSPDGVKWAKYDDNPVLIIGPEGSWDETWVFLPSVIFDESIFKMWYTGSQGNPITYENWQNSIGYATSPDGINWTKYDKPGTIDPPFSMSDPILEPQRTRRGEFDWWSTISPFVLVHGSIYEMWYAGYNYIHNYNIGIARSPDGIQWYRGDNNPVLETGTNDQWDSPIVQNPKVILIDSTYHIWYSAGETFEWQIGYARSDWVDVLGGVDEYAPADISTNFTLSRNYPNPFNPKTFINYELPITNDVDLSIYNLLGQKVAILVSEKQKAGHYQVEWDASNQASGVYFYRIEAGEYQNVKKMILLR